MKKNPIILGFDDAQFSLKSKSIKTTELIGVVCQGIRMVNTIRKTITIDGDDATEALIELINLKKKHVQFVLTDSITFAGFNIFDLNEVYEKTEKPIIAITDREVDLDSVKSALIKKYPQNFKKKFQKILNAGNLYEIEVNTAGGLAKIFFHAKGIELSQVELLLPRISIDSKVPECIRLAHLIGKLF